eukprot:2117917-Pleurochrysis_carterae.AAC.1
MSSGSGLIETTTLHGALTAVRPLCLCRGLVGCLPQTRPPLFSVNELTSFHSSLSTLSPAERSLKYILGVSWEHALAWPAF